MDRRIIWALPVLLGAFGTVGACGGAPSPSPQSQGQGATTPSVTAAAKVPVRVARSNENAKPLLDVFAKYTPEYVSNLGVDGYDEQIVDLREKHEERFRADLARAAEMLRRRHAAESDPLVKQDLAILVHAAEHRIRSSEEHEKHEVPFHAVTNIVFDSMRELLDDRIPAARRNAAVGRLRRYAGLEPGTVPLTDLARTETSAALAASGRMPPSRLEVEKALQTEPMLIDGIEKLFQKYALVGYQEPFAAFKKQIASYQAFLRKDVLPRARTDFRLAPEVYAVELEGHGVAMKPDQLIALGHKGFDEIQSEMQRVAAGIARARKLSSADYRDVMATLKKEQLGPDVVLGVYRRRLSEIEGIIRRERLVTLPTRPANIRLATDAENAQSPAPHMSPPRLIGNTGEEGFFVLTTKVLPPPGAKPDEAQFDDFSHSAITWTLTAHEARPGHELQFAALVERGISIARMAFAYNSANIEGWGLYSEYLLYPFMPPEGQLFSLQARLKRAARVFLDAELQQGKWTPESARAFLRKEVGLSPGFANSEVERYTFRAPGQATSYYYGFTRLLDIRREVEVRLGSKFDLQKFNDFVLEQGLLPPDLLREAALKAFVAPG